MVTDGLSDGLTDGDDDRTILHERPAFPELPAFPEVAEVAEVRAGPRVVLLGSGELNGQLGIALQRLGADVDVIDWQPGVSTTDADELVALIRRLQPDFVVASPDTVSPDALSALEGRPDGASESGEFELVPSARSLRLTADREGLRRLAADELGLPTAPFWFVGSLGELEAVAAHAGYPLLVKPAAGVASRASLANGADDVERAWQHAVGPQAAASTRVLAETKVEIEFHITLIVVRSEGPHGPVIEFCAPIGHAGPGADEPESWQPQQLTTSALDAAKSIAARIVKALGGRGAFSVELMINGDEVYFEDVTPCPQETAWVTLRSQRLSAFELQARAILGLAVDAMMVSPAAARIIDAHRDGGLATPIADALTDALGVPESDVQVFGPARGVALATAPDVETARDRARQVANALAGRGDRGPG